MNRSKKLLNNSLILLFGTFITKGLTFIMAPLFTRWLSIEDYGTFDLLVTYSTLLIPILALGVHHGLFRFLLDDESKENITSTNTNSISINIIGIIIYSIFILIIYFFFNIKINNIFQLTILILAQTFQNYICMFTRGLKKIKLYTIMNIIHTISIFLSVYIFVRVMNMGLSGIIYGYSLGYFIAGLFGCIVTKNIKYFKLNKINKKKTKELLKYSLPMIPYSTSWWIVNVSDRIIVNSVLGVTANAILAVAHKIPNLCTVLYDIFQTAWVETASESIKDKDWENYLNKTLNTMSQICISISIIIVTTNFFLYPILFPSQYNEGKLLVPLFTIAIIFNALSQTIGSVFIAQYNSKQQGTTMIKAGIVNIVVHLLLIKYIGIYASAISTIIAYIYLFLIRYKSINKEYKLKIDKKTIIISLFFILCILFSYLNNTIANIIILIISIFFCIIINKKTLILIINKLIKK